MKNDDTIVARQKLTRVSCDRRRSRQADGPHIPHAVCQSASYAHSEMFSEKALISSKGVDSDWDR
jgi:hypothetical protein